METFDSLFENSRKERKLSLAVTFSHESAALCGLAECQLERFSSVLSSMSLFRDKKYLNETVCETFASFGFCSRVGTCERSHNIDLLMGVELCKSLPKSDMDSIGVGLKREFESSHLHKFLAKESNSAVHNAGIDSFMTGFVLLHYLIKFKKLGTTKGSPPEVCLLQALATDEDLGFRVYLIGKDYPLIIRKSNFANHSSNHQTKKLRTQL